jgi:hypothetical protein
VAVNPDHIQTFWGAERIVEWHETLNIAVGKQNVEKTITIGEDFAIAGCCLIAFVLISRDLLILKERFVMSGSTENPCLSVNRDYITSVPLLKVLVRL